MDRLRCVSQWVWCTSEGDGAGLGVRAGDASRQTAPRWCYGGVLVDTASCAAVTPSPASPTTAPPVLEALHVVTYNLARTEDFIADMQTKSAEEQWECVRKLDTRLQSRV